MNKNFLNDTNVSKILGKIVMYGLLFVFIVFLISHYASKEHNKIVASNNANQYIIKYTGDQKDLIVTASKEADFSNQENGVTYHGLQMKAKSDLSTLIGKITMINLDLVKNKGSQQTIADSSKQLIEIEDGMKLILSDMAKVVPPIELNKEHTNLLNSLSVGISEIEQYKQDVLDGKIDGPTPNEHFTKLKSLF
jgi:hypothetical protein